MILERSPLVSRRPRQLCAHCFISCIIPFQTPARQADQDVLESEKKLQSAIACPVWGRAECKQVPQPPLKTTISAQSIARRNSCLCSRRRRRRRCFRGLAKANRRRRAPEGRQAFKWGRLFQRRATTCRRRLRVTKPLSVTLSLARPFIASVCPSGAHQPQLGAQRRTRRALRTGGCSPARIAIALMRESSI